MLKPSKFRKYSYLFLFSLQKLLLWRSHWKEVNKKAVAVWNMTPSSRVGRENFSQHPAASILRVEEDGDRELLWESW
jgi:hypothetical protein